MGLGSASKREQNGIMSPKLRYAGLGAVAERVNYIIYLTLLPSVSGLSKLKES